MGIRVTTRTRPRRDLPFRFGTTTAAAAATNRWGGPFTVAQFAELLYRVRKVRIVATISHDRYIDPAPEEEPFTEASTTEVDIVLPRRITGGTEGEPEVANELEMLEQSFNSLVFVDSPFTSSFGGFAFDFYLDETGAVWLDGGVVTAAETTGDASLSHSFVDEDDVIINAMLTIGGVEIPFPTRAGGLNVTAATCSITPEEWWPYATSAGAAAWNATTGAPVNGGPGA